MFQNISFSTTHFKSLEKINHKYGGHKIQFGSEKKIFNATIKNCREKSTILDLF